MKTITNGNQAQDFIDENSGNDTVNGGREDDIVRGGSGNDIAKGDLGYAHAYGGNGDDTVIYRREDGVFIIHADGDGNDRLVCRAGASIQSRIWEADDRILNMNRGDQIKIKNHRNGNNIASIDGCG